MNIVGYKIRHQIGEGAMASVYLAVQTSLERQVALKVLTPDLVCQPGFTERFFNEGKIVAHLNHPRIVSVYDLGVQHPNYYMAMELLSGGTLQQKIKLGMTTTQAVGYMKQICTALDFAHQHGVIHRDIKSQNIMFRDGDAPVLTDFGIARLAETDLRLTIPGRTVGSPLYMSPEQISGRRIDARSDLYSVGILFYEMLTRQLPFYSDQFMAVALMHKTEPIPTLPDQLSLFQPVLDRLLAKEPDHRYSSALELIEALSQIESDGPVPLHLHPSNTSEVNSSQRSSRPSGDKFKGAVAPREDLTGEITQPAMEMALGNKPASNTTSQAVGDPLDPDQDKPREEAVTPLPLKNRGGPKMGLVLAGVLLVLAMGLYGAVQSGLEPAAVWGRLTSRQAALPQKVDPLLPNEAVALQHAEPAEQVRSEPHQEEPAPAPITPPDDQQGKAQKTAALLAKAQTQLAKNHLTSPAGDNCYETYQQLLALDPTGKTADSVLIKICKAYGRLAYVSKIEGRWQEGLQYVGKGINLRPEDKTLLALQVELRAGLDDQIQAAREQAQKNEQLEQLRAAKRAEEEKRRKAEEALEARRKLEAEHQMLLRKIAEQEKKEQQAPVVVEQPEPEEKDTDSRKRLFGTF